MTGLLARRTSDVRLRGGTALVCALEIAFRALAGPRIPIYSKLRREMPFLEIMTLRKSWTRSAWARE